MNLTPDLELALLDAVLGCAPHRLATEYRTAALERRREIDLLFQLRPDLRRWRELVRSSDDGETYGQLRESVRRPG